MLDANQVFPNRVAGVIRSQDAEAAFRACLAAIGGGVGTVEVTTGVPGWEGVVRRLVAEAGSTPVGVGTVVEPGMVAEAAAAGAGFVVTPYLVPEVAAAAREHDLFLVMGALTPTEIQQALQVHGAQVVKVFPVAALGGPDYIRWISGPLPGLPLWVSGGVEIAQVAEYLKLGVKAVGLTTALFPPEALETGDWSRVEGLARQAVSALAAVR